MKKRSNTISAVATILFIAGLLLMFGVACSTMGTGNDLQSNHATMGDPSEQVFATIPTEPYVPTATEPLVVLSPAYTEPEPTADTTPPEALGLNTKYAFVYDTKEQHAMYLGGDPDAPLAPASVTKLMTAYAILQNMDPATVVTVGDEVNHIDPESSRAWLLPGQQLTVEMLIQAMMLPSGNDAAYTLAVACGLEIAEDPDLEWERAYQVFMDEMNAQARLLGMKSSHFANPDGIDEEGHYTTIRDLITLSKAVLHNDLIMKYASMAKATVTFVSGETVTWSNSNYLLHPEYAPYYIPEAVGLKTGTTDDAGCCLISAFRQDDGGYILVGILGSVSNASRYNDTLTLYNKYKHTT